MKIKECNIEEIMLEEYRNFSERSFRNTKGKNEFEEDKKSTDNGFEKIYAACQNSLRD